MMRMERRTEKPRLRRSASARQWLLRRHVHPRPTGGVRLAHGQRMLRTARPRDMICRPAPAHRPPRPADVGAARRFVPMAAPCAGAVLANRLVRFYAWRRARPERKPAGGAFLQAAPIGMPTGATPDRPLAFSGRSAGFRRSRVAGVPGKMRAQRHAPGRRQAEAAVGLLRCVAWHRLPPRQPQELSAGMRRTGSADLVLCAGLRALWAQHPYERMWCGVRNCCRQARSPGDPDRAIPYAPGALRNVDDVTRRISPQNFGQNVLLSKPGASVAAIAQPDGRTVVISTSNLTPLLLRRSACASTTTRTCRSSRGSFFDVPVAATCPPDLREVRRPRSEGALRVIYRHVNTESGGSTPASWRSSISKDGRRRLKVRARYAPTRRLFNSSRHSTAFAYRPPERADHRRGELWHRPSREDPAAPAGVLPRSSTSYRAAFTQASSAALVACVKPSMTRAS